MKKSQRQYKIGDELHREISIIIREDVKDKRVTSVLVSVLSADVTNDLKYCKVFVSVMGTDHQKKEAIEGLMQSAGFIRREIARRINLRNTPEIKFELDESLDMSIRISEILRGDKNDKGI